MPLKLSQIKNEVKTVSVPFGDGALNVEYRPAEFNAKVNREFQKLDAELADKVAAGKATEDEAATLVAGFAVRVIAAWDLEDDAGKPCPITPRFLADEVGYMGIARIIRAVVEDVNPTSPAGR